MSTRLPMRRTGRGGRCGTLPLMMLWTCAFEQRSSRATSATVRTFECCATTESAIELTLAGAAEKIALVGGGVDAAASQLEIIRALLDGDEPAAKLYAGDA